MNGPTAIFDNHQHVGGVPGIPGHHATGALDDSQIARDHAIRVEAMQRVGTSQAALMPGHSYPRPNGLADTRTVNDTLAAYRRFDSERFPAVIGTVEPRYGADGLAEIDRVHALGFQGLSWHHRQQGLAIDHPVMHTFAERMVDHGLVAFIHCYPDGDFESVWRLRNLAESHPELAVLCMDTGTHTEAFEEALRCAERAANVFVDLTSFSLGASAIERAVAVLGAERIVFGTNLYSLTRPVRSHELDMVMAAALTDAQRRAILGGNARRLLGLS